MDANAHDFMGAHIGNLFSAEVSAGMLARMWIVQEGRLTHEKRIVILYDSESAAAVISGRYVPHPCADLCKCSCAIHRFVGERYNVRYFYVNGHSSHPWNKLVDAMCTHFANKPQENLRDSHNAFASKESILSACCIYFHQRICR